MNAMLTRWSRPGSFVSADNFDDPTLEPAMMDRTGVWEAVQARSCTADVGLVGRTDARVLRLGFASH